MIHRAHDFKMVEPTVFSRREVNRALLTAALPTPLFDFAIAGGFYHGVQAAQATLRPGMALDLRREPENPHDADAIAVHLPVGLILGYVPCVANTPVVRLLDSGRTVRGKIVRMPTAERDEDISDDLVFTCFTSGDPMIRLTAESTAA